MTRPIRIALVLAVALTAISQSPATELPETSGNPDWNLELFLSTGAIAGIMDEYVYSGSRTLSYLDWQLMPLVTVGAGIRGAAPWGARVGVRATLPLTRVSGTMTNSDYDDPLAPTNATRISHHTAIVDTYRDLDGVRRRVPRSIRQDDRAGRHLRLRRNVG
jgi:outer membrane protease